MTFEDYKKDAFKKDPELEQLCKKSQPYYDLITKISNYMTNNNVSYNELKEKCNKVDLSTDKLDDIMNAEETITLEDIINLAYAIDQPLTITINPEK